MRNKIKRGDYRFKTVIINRKKVDITVECLGALKYVVSTPGFKMRYFDYHLRTAISNFKEDYAAALKNPVYAY